jgi:hypothetical protein
MVRSKAINREPCSRGCSGSSGGSGSSSGGDGINYWLLLVIG